MSNLLDEIAKLRGSISGYRNKESSKEITSNEPYTACRGRGGFRGRSRGGGRGHRGGFSIRNRTLIVKPQEDPDSNYVSVTTSNGHKLVNKDIYEQELQRGNLTKEEKQQALQRKLDDKRKKSQALRASRNKVKLDLCDWCLIDGQLFAVSKYGARLVLLDSEINSERTGSQTWNDKRYIRSKAGNLKLQNQKVFLKEQCRYFQKTGECSRLDKCKYTHNKAKVMLCPQFIKGNCRLVDCPLSHEPSEFNVALCHFFGKGHCKNEHCPFLHISPELELVCRLFAIGGYCFRGSQCKLRHVHECPDFQLSRACPRGKNCRLSHKSEDNITAKLQFQSLDGSHLQLPDLTAMGDIHSDPRVMEIEEDIEQLSETDESDNESRVSQTEDLEVDADFVHF